MKQKPAFTLIEVIAAVAILSIALIVLIQNQTQAINNVMMVENYERAVYIAENQLHWTYLDLNEAEDWQEYADLSGEDGDFRWSVAIQEAERENADAADVVLLRMVSYVVWPEGTREKSVELESWYLWGKEQ